MSVLRRSRRFGRRERIPLNPLHTIRLFTLGDHCAIAFALWADGRALKACAPPRLSADADKRQFKHTHRSASVMIDHGPILDARTRLRLGLQLQALYEPVLDEVLDPRLAELLQQRETDRGATDVGP